VVVVVDMILGQLVVLVVLVVLAVVVDLQILAELYLVLELPDKEILEAVVEQDLQLLVVVVAVVQEDPEIEVLPVVPQLVVLVVNSPHLLVH
jgi:hypothetical protein